jgi:hypothetical protein
VIYGFTDLFKGAGLKGKKSEKGCMVKGEKGGKRTVFSPFRLLSKSVNL